MSDDVLALIDGAIGDYLSGDSMRWTPDQPEELSTRRSQRGYGPPSVAAPRSPRVTSVEVTVRTDDGQVMHVEFPGEHNLVEVEVATETERDDSLWPLPEPYRMSSSLRRSATMTIKSRLDMGGDGVLYRVRQESRSG